MMPKISYASTMIVEDHLKKMLASTSNKPFKAADNKLLPRNQHSAFGDFPREYLPPKKATVTNVEPIDTHELSIAAKAICKYLLTSYQWLAILKKGEGSGGKAVSLAKPKERPTP